MATLNTNKDYFGRLLILSYEYGARVGYLLSEDGNYFSFIIADDSIDTKENDIVQFKLEDVEGVPNGSSPFLSYIALVNKKIDGVPDIGIPEISVSEEDFTDHRGRVKSAPMRTVEDKFLKFFTELASDEKYVRQEGDIEDVDTLETLEFVNYRYKKKNEQKCALNTGDEITYKPLGNKKAKLNKKNGCPDVQ